MCKVGQQDTGLVVQCRRCDVDAASNGVWQQIGVADAVLVGADAGRENGGCTKEGLVTSDSDAAKGAGERQ